MIIPPRGRHLQRATTMPELPHDATALERPSAAILGAMGLRRAIVHRIGAVPLVATAFAKVGAPLDTWLAARTGGRVTLLGKQTMPQLVLTTTGRKSGQPRTVTVAYGRLGDELLLVGSNFGQEQHPAWALNLEATPSADVDLDGARFTAHARLLQDPAERDAAWAVMDAVYPGYRAYRARVQNREIKMFALSVVPVATP
jgi:deazaflavin-dependent oxidoreductase (nitroreductase family)